MRSVRAKATATKAGVITTGATLVAVRRSTPILITVATERPISAFTSAWKAMTL